MINSIILGNTDNCLKLDPIKVKLKDLVEVIEVDGHNLDELTMLFKKTDKSKIVLAKTIKGKDFQLWRIKLIGIMECYK